MLYEWMWTPLAAAAAGLALAQLECSLAQRVAVKRLPSAYWQHCPFLKLALSQGLAQMFQLHRPSEQAQGLNGCLSTILCLSPRLQPGLVQD